MICSHCGRAIDGRKRWINTAHGVKFVHSECFADAARNVGEIGAIVEQRARQRASTFDPSREELLATINSLPFVDEFDEYDKEGAIFWFANDWHGGQNSALYSALSMSPYRHSALESGADATETMATIYDALVAAHTDASADNGTDAANG